MKEGDCLRVDLNAQRSLKAADDSSLSYLCMQTRSNSLEGFTMTDGVVSDEFAKPSWLK